MNLSTCFRVFATASCVLIGACVAEVGDESDYLEDVGLTTQGLNGTIASFSGCAPNQITNITNAFGPVAIIVAQRTALIDCLKSGYLSGADAENDVDVDYPEWIVQRMNAATPTSFVCQPAGAGSTNGAPETVFLDANHISSGTANLAAVIAHEISHTKGYAHPGDMAPENLYTVPGQVGECVRTLTAGVPALPFHTLRSTVAESEELTLPAVGFSGTNTPFVQRQCDPSFFVNGFHGRADNGGVRSLGLRCRNVAGTTPAQLAAQGAAGGTSFNANCQSGEMMVGAHGRGTQALASIGPICARTSDVLAGSLTDLGLSATFGGVGVVSWNRRCPAFHALKAVRLRAETMVERIELVCQDMRDPRSMATSSVAANGGDSYETSNVYDEYCPGKGAISSLWGVIHSPGGVRRLGASCTDVDRSGNQLVVSTTKTSQPVAGLGGGGYGDDHSEDSAVCSNSLLVGLEVQSTAHWIRSVRPLCANDVAGWHAGSSGAYTAGSRVGRNIGGGVNSVCPARHFVSGWRITTERGLHSIALRCRAF